MISVVVLTKNEEKNIEECLKSLSWCDEKIIIDDHSIDNTVELAKKQGAKVYSRSLNNDFASQRNFGLEKAKGDWILFIDADERVSSALWYEIIAHINEPTENFAGFFIKRKDTIWNKQLNYGETGKIKLIRLARKDAGKWTGKVHEVWQIKGKIDTLNNPLNHYPHPTITEFLKEINYYTDLRAYELYEKKTPTNWLFLILYPQAKFILNYIIKAGFLDGLPGLVSALMMAFHSFLVRGKLWTLWQNNPKST
jgi:glycosyltransferase involved in cell wall biosynthesis